MTASLLDKREDAHPPDVRRHRAELRPAQPPAEPEHRSLLALANDAAGPARRTRRRSSTSAPAPATWPSPTTGPAGGACRSSAPTSATPMLVGRRQGAAARAASRVSFLEADAQGCRSPTTRSRSPRVAFGLRNVTDTDRGIAEMVRVTQPGGRVAILEFSRAAALAVRPAVPLLLPPLAAARRPADFAQPRRRVPLPAGQRAGVPRRRSAGRADAAHGLTETCAVIRSLRHRDAVRRREGMTNPSRGTKRTAICGMSPQPLTAPAAVRLRFNDGTSIGTWLAYSA